VNAVEVPAGIVGPVAGGGGVGGGEGAAAQETSLSGVNGVLSLQRLCWCLDKCFIAQSTILIQQLACANGTMDHGHRYLATGGALNKVTAWLQCSMVLGITSKSLRYR
jgi:hypothetical protein